MSAYTEKYPISAAQREMAASGIQRLIDNPPLPKPETPAVRNEKEVERQRAIGTKALADLRALACKQTGLTLEQLLEAEKNVSHSASVIPESAPPLDLALRRAKLAGMPDLYRKHVIERIPLVCKPLSYVKAFLSSGHRFLMLSGGPGTFKSGSACWAISQIDGSRYVEARALTRIHIEQREKFEELMRGPLLVLDDLGRERSDSKAAFIAAFDEIFDNAYMNSKRLIITSNVTAQQFAREPENGGYGSRVADRFKEAGVWKIIEGASQRASLRLPDREPGEDDV